MCYEALERGQALVAFNCFCPGGAFLLSPAKAMNSRKAGATVCEKRQKVPGGDLVSFTSVIAVCFGVVIK